MGKLCPSNHIKKEIKTLCHVNKNNRRVKIFQRREHLDFIVTSKCMFIKDNYFLNICVKYLVNFTKNYMQYPIQKIAELIYRTFNVEMFLFNKSLADKYDYKMIVKVIFEISKNFEKNVVWKYLTRVIFYLGNEFFKHDIVKFSDKRNMLSTIYPFILCRNTSRIFGNRDLAITIVSYL